MSDKFTRFAAGEISRCNLSSPRICRSKTDPSKTWDQYSAHINGCFEDNYEPVDQYFNSRYPVAVYDKNGNEPIDPSITDNKTFKGRIMITQTTSDEGKVRYYLKAVCVSDIIEEFTTKGNPFKENPLT